MQFLKSVRVFRNNTNLGKQIKKEHVFCCKNKKNRFGSLSDHRIQKKKNETFHLSSLSLYLENPDSNKKKKEDQRSR